LGFKRFLGRGTFAPDAATTFQTVRSDPQSRKTTEGDDSTVPVGFTLERQLGKDRKSVAL
jgi:hypothetical protein